MFDQAISLDATDTETYIDSSTLYYLKQYDEALAAYTLALSPDLNSSKTLMTKRLL